MKQRTRPEGDKHYDEDAHEWRDGPPPPAPAEPAKPKKTPAAPAQE